MLLLMLALLLVTVIRSDKYTAAALTQLRHGLAARCYCMRATAAVKRLR
jgi:hypothetical protein